MKTFPILYKRAKTGAPQSWQIFVEGNTFYTEAGQVGGVISRSTPSICEGKNIGRANETSPEMQAELEATAKHQKKMSDSYRESLDDIDQKSNYFEPMLANKFVEEKHKIKWVDGVIVQPKLDGIRGIPTIAGANTRKGKPHMCIPHVLEVLEGLFDKDRSMILDGEVYNHELHDDFNQISSIVRKQKPTAEDLEIARQLAQFHCYDCPQIGGLTQAAPFIERYSAMKEVMSPLCIRTSYVHIVPIRMAYSEEEVLKCHDEFLADGYEGVIVRAAKAPYINGRCDYLLKYKVFDDDEFVIEDVLPGDKGLKANMAAKIVIHTKDGVECKPNIKAPHSVLKVMLAKKEMYIGKTCTVRYFGVTSDGSLRFPYMIDIDRWIYE